MNLEASGRQSVRASALLSALRSRKVLDACKLLGCAALLVAAAGAQPAADWTIDTIAGSVYGGDGGQATATQLYFPYGVTLDGSGNLYIATTGNNRIRKVDTAGIITTVAGNGERGYGGDGGAATAAQLSSPWDVTVDGSGNLYIVDTGNNRIRKVDADGIITTVAGNGERDFGGDGGSATAAKLHWPRGVAVDGSGNIYIADAGNHRVRKVDATTRNISTVAGSGDRGYGGDGGSATAAAVKLDSPWDVALDGSGNLYIADRNNYRIRRVDADGNIATFAGDGTSGCCNDGGLATAAFLGRPQSLALDGSNNLYSISFNAHRIRKVTAATGIITTIAGGTNRGFNGDGGLAATTLLFSPQGVAVDGSGNLYFADLNNQRVRRVDATTKIVSTVAGGATGDGGPATAAHLNFPQGVETDGAGNFYVSDALNYRIRKIDAAGNISTVVGNGKNGFSGDGGQATLAQTEQIVDTALDGDGNLYIPDAFNNRIRKVDAETGIISTIAGTGMNGAGGDGGQATAAQLDIPWSVALDGDGNLYIADRENNRIRKIDADTKIISTVAGGGTGGDGSQATAAQLNSPHGVALDGDGNIYIANALTHSVRKVDADTKIISTVAGNGTQGFSGDGGQATAAQLNFPHSLALDGDGNLYIADRDNYCIRWVNADTGIIATVAGIGTRRGYSKDGGLAAQSQLYGAYGVMVDGAGYIYIADANSYRIRRVGPPSPGDDPPPAPPVPPAPPRESEPAVRARTLELAFVLRQDDAPAAQEVVLYAENGAVDFRAQPTQRWTAVEPASGSLEEDEETVLTVTVDPAGLRVGRREGRVYVRSEGRVTARVRIALTVRPAAGPAVSEHGVVNAAALSAFGERGLFGPRLRPAAAGSLVVVRGENLTANGETVVAEGFPLPASLGGVTVKFAGVSGARSGLAARLFAVGPQRIYAQLPSLLGMEAAAAGGTTLATVVVETAEGSSYPRRFWTGPHGPGIFTMSEAGTGQGAVVLAGTTVLAAPPGFSGDIRLAQPGEAVNIYTTSRPARAGDVLEIYATGLGAVDPPQADGANSCEPQSVCLDDFSNVTLRRTTARPRVWIGGVEVAADGVLFSGLAPTLAAVDMVVVEAPAGIAPSDAAEVVIAIGGRTSQPGVTIAVE